jgi:hypothetical protein
MFVLGAAHTIESMMLLKCVVKIKTQANKSLDVRQKQLLFMNLPLFPHVARYRFLPTSTQSFACFLFSTNGLLANEQRFIIAL